MGKKMKPKHLLGLVIDNHIVSGVGRYYDLSLESMTNAFEMTPTKTFSIHPKEGYAISCDLYLGKYMKVSK